jgi:hypothetical protein
LRITNDPSTFDSFEQRYPRQLLRGSFETFVVLRTFE